MFKKMSSALLSGYGDDELPGSDMPPNHILRRSRLRGSKHPSSQKELRYLRLSPSANASKISRRTTKIGGGSKRNSSPPPNTIFFTYSQQAIIKTSAHKRVLSQYASPIGTKHLKERETSRRFRTTTEGTRNIKTISFSFSFKITTKSINDTEYNDPLAYWLNRAHTKGY